MKKNLCVGNNVGAKKSEYTCAKSPLPCLEGLTPKRSLVSVAAVLFFWGEASSRL